MTLSPGMRLGAYEITGAIGAGGMGEVYRGRDATLNRDVAIKVLPAAMAADNERLARFKREAQVLASLNHPNIAAIFGMEVGAPLVGALGGDDRERAGTRPAPTGPTIALVMEMVEGEDLSERLKRGAIPVDEAIAIAKQIADGLEEAHEHGVIHRDLKPANVKVTPDGKVKILDFGLAKAIEGDPSSSAANSQLSHSPTISRHMTEAGMIMGTAAYMSPEQARGKIVDKRADIWSFGVVLFEMLSGERLFAGDTVSDVLAAVLRQDVDWAKLPTATPARVRELLRRCLSKEVKERLQAIGEARIALASPDGPAIGAHHLPSTAGPAAPGRLGLPRPSAWTWGLVALALLGWATTAIVLTRRGSNGPLDLRTSLAMPDGLGIPTLTYSGSQSLATLTVSPRGDQVAFVGWQNGEGALYLRRFDSYDSVRLVKTEEAMAPFFSPDGGRLGFFARGRLWRIDLPGGVPVDLAPAAVTSVGGSWGEDGQIVYTPNYAESLWMIPAEGGTPRPLTKLNSAAGELSHRWPCILPGGAGVLFTIKLSTHETLNEARIAVADPKTGEYRVLVEGGTMPRYLDDGRLVFARAGKLYAVAFDPRSRAVRGAPVPVLEDVSTGPNNGAAWYDVTRSGLLAYLPGGEVRLNGRLAWEGPGRATRIIERLGDRVFGRLRLSRDAKLAIMQVPAANDTLWLVDLEQMNATRLPPGGGNDAAAVLSSDGRFVLFSSDRAGGDFRFYRAPLNGSAPAEVMFEGTGQMYSISYPAHMLGYSLDTPGDGKSDAYVVSVADDGALAGEPIQVGGGDGYQDSPAISPDGMLVAYVSRGVGDPEIYVATIADPGKRRRLTNKGGFDPLWSPDGKRLFFVTENRVVAVSLTSPSELRFGPPQVVSSSDVAGQIDSFDIAPDGASVLVGRLPDPLMLRRDIRLWPGWGKTLPPVK